MLTSISILILGVAVTVQAVLQVYQYKNICKRFSLVINQYDTIRMDLCRLREENECYNTKVENTEEKLLKQKETKEAELKNYIVQFYIKGNVAVPTYEISNVAYVEEKYEFKKEFAILNGETIRYQRACENGSIKFIYFYDSNGNVIVKFKDDDVMYYHEK